ncbi:putative 2-hydroxyacid dehydrogenase [[Candida] railenensis]|uniref:2-hydroxyacid dehydrogenase n=1 Tax=[Candida] railenensis TaxID=45579 RepID=A0A9P0QLV5_9ASCO|nr:putative 2-hydroxyacid dehydrogenase [[Candida] railenensis]
MSKAQVLFIGELDKTLPEYLDFKSKFDCIEYSFSSKEQVIEDFKTKYQNVQAIYGAWLGFFAVGGFRNELLENAPPSLKVISIASVGYDGYDGPGMKSKNIVLTNVPSDGAAGPVADLVLYNTLASFRNFRTFEENFHTANHTIVTRNLLENSTFDSKFGKPVLRDTKAGYAFGEQCSGRQVLSPEGHSVLIVGFGNIGQTIGRRLSGIGMHVHYTKRSKLSDEQESNLGYKVTYHSSILEAKDIVDLVVIACPATPETKHLINKDVIDAISKPFRIVNIGRGSVIDEQALVNGLESGKILFAGLDVFEGEPKCHESLLTRKDVILTPHIGASTKENFDHTAVVALKNIENVLKGGEGLTRVN